MVVAETARRHVDAFIEATRPDALILSCSMFDPAARLRSFEIAGEWIRAG